MSINPPLRYGHSHHLRSVKGDDLPLSPACWAKWVTTDTRLNINVVEFYDSQQEYGKRLTLPSVPPSG